MSFARWVFGIAGVYGLLVLTPSLFAEASPGATTLADPVFYYGFLGVAIVWQLAFLLIARDPVRYRPLMLVGAAEKLSFFGACTALYLGGRIGITSTFVGAMLDGVLLLAFLAAWWASRPEARPVSSVVPPR